MSKNTMDTQPMDDLPITDTMIANARPMAVVKRARIVSGLSQPEFARDHGIQLGTLRNWEQGRGQPDALRLTCIVLGSGRSNMNYDPAKNILNERNNGVSLAFGVRVVNTPRAIETLDDRMPYGEDRWMVLGMVDGVVWSVVYTERYGEVWCMSVRRATARESDLYFRT